MNENLNLVEILKDCPKGTKLYSTIFGEVQIVGVYSNAAYEIKFRTENGTLSSITSDGRYYNDFNGECTLFPSKEQRDWSKFKVKKPKFDPKTLKPFDKVLARLNKQGIWYCELLSFVEGDTNLIKCCGAYYQYCIPYNDETKHLVGTTEEAPEYYRYWEDWDNDI